MGTFLNAMGIELIIAIVPFGMGTKILHASKDCGVTGGTIFLGRGTIHSSILNFFAITDTRKEIVLMAAESAIATCVMKAMHQKFHIEKSHHGIVFSLPLTEVIGTRCIECEKQNSKGRPGKLKYQLIVAIVDKGKAELVMEAATKAGATGGTIINARGSGIHETSKIFAMDIEPEKEIVMILETVDKLEAIVDRIHQDLKMDLPGNGILFTQNVNKAYGMMK